jgi:hypothetical protein
VTLQTQEEPDMEQGFETRIMPIASEVVLDEAILPDHESKNNEAISEAQIVLETAKCCGQPRCYGGRLLHMVESGRRSGELHTIIVVISCMPRMPPFIYLLLDVHRPFSSMKSPSCHPRCGHSE